MENGINSTAYAMSWWLPSSFRLLAIIAGWARLKSVPTFVPTYTQHAKTPPRRARAQPRPPCPGL